MPKKKKIEPSSFLQYCIEFLIVLGGIFVLYLLGRALFTIPAVIIAKPTPTASPIQRIHNVSQIVDTKSDHWKE